MKTKHLTIIILSAFVIAISLAPSVFAADKYWKGSGASDNIDVGGNWWDGSGVGTGDNLYFDGVEGAKQPYCNKGGDAWYGNIETWDEAPAITWSGDYTTAVKFENNASPNLFKIQSNIGSRSGLDLEINPVGSGGMQVTGNVSINDADKWLKIWGSDDLEITGIISGAGGVDMTIYATPTVILSGANTFPHEFNIYGGIVDLRNADPLDCEVINLGQGSGSQDATVQLGANAVDVDVPVTVISGSTGTKYLKNSAGNTTNEFSGDITMLDPLTVSAVNTATLELNGEIYATDKTVTLNDSGTVVLSGASAGTFAHSGTGFDIQNGTLKTSANEQTGTPSASSANYIKLDNWAIFRATDTYSLNGNKGIELQAGHGKIYVDDTKKLSVNSDITGDNQLAKTGLGTLYMGGGDEFTVSALYIDAGTLWPIETTPFNGSLTTVNLGAESGSDPATLKLGSGGSTESMAKSITVRAGSGGTKTIETGNSGGDCNFNGQIILKDSVTLVVTNGATMDLVGGVDMSADGDHDVTIIGTDYVNFSGVIEADTGAAAINHNGTGTIELGADNAGGIVNQMMINIGSNGTVLVSDPDGLGDDPTVGYPDKINFLASGVLSNTVDIALTSDAGVTIADGVTATFGVGDGSSDDLVIDGVISDGGSNDGQVRKTGPGSLKLRGVNTYGGSTTIEDGRLDVVADDGLGSAGVGITINGGTLYVSNAFTIADTRAMALGAEDATIENTKTVTYSGTITGSGILTKAGSGTLDLSAGTSTYTNKTIITGGTLRIGSDTSLGTPPSSAIPGHILLTTSGNSTLYADNTFELNANRGIEIAATGGKIQVLGTGSKVLTYGGIIAGAGDLTKTGSGTLVLTGPNTYGGGTTVESGTLKGTTTGLRGDITVDPGDDLEFDQEGNGTYAGEISGGGNLTKSGGGTVTLSGANAHTGTTDVDGGALIITGSHSGGGAYTVSGGTLGGNGPISAPVSVTSGGTIRGGSSGSPDILDLNSALTLASGATLEAELTGSTAGTGYSQIDVAGDVALGGATLSASLSYVPAQAAKIVLVKSAGTTTGTFSGISEGDTVVLSYNGTDYTFYVHYGADGDTGETTGGNDVMLLDIRTPPTLIRFR